MYLRFDVPQTENYFLIRASDHSKIDELDADAVEIFDAEIIINIFSSQTKKEAINYIKDYFSKIKNIPNSRKGFFENKIEKRIIKSKHEEVVLKFLKKIKVDSTKTDKQIQQSILDYLVKKGTTATLKKRDYTYKSGRWILNGEREIRGVIDGISSTGNQVTIKGETGKDYDFVSKKDKYILLMAQNKSKEWTNLVEKINTTKK